MEPTLNGNSGASGSWNNAEPVISVRGLNHFFGQKDVEKQVLFDNHLEVMPGELVIMTGPSGSGKTTILTLIGGLRSVQQGSLRVMGQELRALGRDALVEHRQRIGFIFQAHNLFPALNALKNVRMGLWLSDKSAEEKNDLSRTMLERVGLGHRLYNKPHQLSGGQKQRVAIARALVNHPRIVLADEPTAALDKDSSRDVVELFKQLVSQEKCSILMVTHDSRILDAADRIVNMMDGRIISDTAVKESVTICEFLHGSPLFGSQTAAELSAIARRMTKERYESGATVIRQGDAGDKFYLIRRGSAEVEVNDGGAPRRIATLEPGQFFGEAALLTEQPRNATVRAREPLEVYWIGRDDFKSTLEQCGGFKDQVLNTILGRG